MEYRIWDKDSGYFIKVSDTNKHYLSSNGDIIIINEMGDIYETDKENYIINKYTGLKDNKEYKIYEDDILLSSNENGTFLQLIGFGDSEREYDSILKGFKIIDSYTLENDDYEIIECKPLTQELVKKYDIPVIEKENIIMDGWWVIGNKWENPELMKLLEGKDDKKR